MNDPGFAKLARGQQLAELEATIRKLEAWGVRRDWRGTDPYDGLNARRLSFLKRTPLRRRALIQLVKRSPFDLRGVLAIEPGQSSVALANVISAYARMDFLDRAEREDKVDRLVARLAELRCHRYAEPCWGYHFDVETRFFFYPKTTPNTIATAFVGLSLLDAHEALGEPRLLELAERTGDFFLAHVAQTRAGERNGAFFGYFPGDQTPIHNANLLVCCLLARLAGEVGRADFQDASRAGVAYALDGQRPDGSWPYSERPNLGWVDNFHTGYVLDSLFLCLPVLGNSAIKAAYERGLSFYVKRLFLEDGTPKYLIDSVYPIDALCAAQGIQTFSLAATLDNRWLDWAWRVYRYATSRMQHPDGSFGFQRLRFWVNHTPHIRWVEAPMLSALTRLHSVAAKQARP